jgi:LuxR family maltose regulon positive regulatory protein
VNARKSSGPPVVSSATAAADRAAPGPTIRCLDGDTLVDEVADLRRTLTSSTPTRAGATPLTPAELRLLPYLQTHLTIREIGERLFLSRNTVSTEVGSIYRKLGVSSRSDAVFRATAVGLLGE